MFLIQLHFIYHPRIHLSIHLYLYLYLSVHLFIFRPLSTKIGKCHPVMLGKNTVYAGKNPFKLINQRVGISIREQHINVLTVSGS